MYICVSMMCIPQNKDHSGVVKQYIDHAYYYYSTVDETCISSVDSSCLQGGVGIKKRHLGSNFFFQRQEVDLPTT